MSGFAALFHPGGEPVDRGLLATLAASLAASERRPDHVWIHAAGPVGLVQARRAASASGGGAGSADPALPSEAVAPGAWAVGDVRLDGRADLARRLGWPRVPAATEAVDLALLRDAWGRWGEAMVEHLRGDFAFVAWDARAGRLFAARDHFGVRPLYHARAGDAWLVSNRLDAIRHHPAVADTVDPAVVLDHLLLDCNLELEKTVFAGVRRLPAAHCATLGDGPAGVRRYWRLPEPAVRWRREADLLEEFRHRLDQAVNDRRRPGGTAIWLSGGLDSTALAAAGTTARTEAAGPVGGLAAITVVYDRLFADEERRYAGQAAAALRLPIEFIAADDIPLFEGWARPERRMAEPLGAALAGSDWRLYEAAARRGSVVWYGEGGDEILPARTVRQVARHLPWPVLGRGVLAHLLRRRRLPPLGTGLLEAWRGLTRSHDREDRVRFPAWLAPEIAARAGLRERFDRWHGEEAARPEGCGAASFQPAWWSQLLEDCAEKGARCGVEVALPFLDLRVVECAWGLPPLPWASDKYLLRRLGRGRLPPAVLARPKTGLAGDPAALRLRTAEDWRQLEEQVPLPADLEEYVSRPRFRESLAATPAGVWDVWTRLRPFELAAWWQNGRRRPEEPARRTRGDAAPPGSRADR